MTQVKKWNKELAEQLYPFYVESAGNIRAVHRKAVELKIEISAPTLYEMAACFGWAKRYQELIDGQFTSIPRTGDDLVDLLLEVRHQKGQLRKVIEAADNLADFERKAHMKAHTEIGKLIAQELKLLELIKKDKARAEDAAKAVAASVAKKGGLTAEAAAAIRQQILGVQG